MAPFYLDPKPDTGVGTKQVPAPDSRSAGSRESIEKRDIEKSGGGRVEDASSDIFAAMVEAEGAHDIKLRTMSWQKTAVLLFGEYVCLAIMAQAWSFSILGYVPGLLITLGTGAMTWYTSYIMWQYVMKHPEVRDICDIGYLLFGKSKIAYELTALMLLLNNIFLMGFHVLTGSKILNTLSNHSQCTVLFSAIIMIASIICSIPRTLNHVSYMSVASAIAMFIAILLNLIFAGAEDHPAYGYGGAWPAMGDYVTSRAVPVSGTTFVNGMNAALNITFLWVGQILYPSFIAEMERPQDFPKALAALSIAEFILFAVPAIVGYRYFGQYATAPAFGSLQPVLKKISFSFVIIPTVIIGVIYANVAAKYMYKRIMRNSRHAHSNTVLGWGVWIGVMVISWALAFVIGEVIPSFGDFLSIMSAAFDSFFGFIFWAVAFWELNRGKLFKNASMMAHSALNVFILIVGVTMLGPGLYTSIEAIKIDYAGPTSGAFSCADNSL